MSSLHARSKVIMLLVLLMLAVALIMPNPGVSLAQGSGRVPLSIEGPTDLGAVELALDRVEGVPAEPGAPDFAPRSWSAPPGDYELDVSSMPDGYYRLSLDTNPAFFRKPQGYFFGVLDGQLIVSAGREGSLYFQITSLTDQDLPTCRMIAGSPPGQGTNPGADPDRAICQAEYYLDLSAPLREPRSGNVDPVGLSRFADANMLQGGLLYKYVGIKTTRVSDGVRATLSVVNTETPHYWTQGDHWVEHVYALVSQQDQNKWMEAGWAEVSWNPDIQYLYEFDGVYNQWRLFPQYSLSPGSSVTVRVYNTTANRWRAEYYTGSYWVVLADEDLNYGSTFVSFLSGERYSTAYYDPYVPRSGIYNGQLLISGSWTLWTTSTTTFEFADSPYYNVFWTRYTNFNIGS